MLHYFLKIKWWKLIRLSPVGFKIYQPNIRNNNKINNREQRKFLSNYENQREYSKEFLESLYAN